MKALSKPISSPNRAEKYPPPLMMRFLRNNVGSRSRGRSRSSPMFYNIRSKKSAIENNQLEPSSPKVTCIGQVRIRRSKGKKRGGASVNNLRGRWLPTKESFFWGKLSLRFWSKKRSFRKVCCVKWGIFFRSGYCKKVDATGDSFVVYDDGLGDKDGNFTVKSGDNVKSRVRSGSHGFSRRSNINNSKNVEELINCERVRVDDDKTGSCSRSPPKNALLLTRCRSAPYRSSSLAGRFWGSPLTGHEGGGDHNNKVDESDQSEWKLEVLQKPSREDSEKEPRTSQEISSKESMKNVSVSRGQVLRSGASQHPLLLTRCKSEPARTGWRLVNP